MRGEKDIEALRSIISKCASALGNGASISTDCSIAFMGELPSEIGLHVASLIEDRDGWKERAISAEAERDALRDADLVPRSLLAEANLEMASVCAEKLQAKDEKLRKAQEALNDAANIAIRIPAQHLGMDKDQRVYSWHDVMDGLSKAMTAIRARATLAEIEKVLK